MPAEDPYATLEVEPTASADAIKKAYRRLARTWHPDRNPDDPSAEERFKSVQAAYDTLSDAEKRRAYDRSRQGRFAGARAGEARGAETAGFESAFGGAFGGEGFGPTGFDPLFSFFFDGEAARTAAPADMAARVDLTFNQALRGGATEVRRPGGEVVRLAIPKGVRSGFKVRVRPRDEDGAAPRGDLYVTFHVEPSARFRREGDNLHLAETISAIEATLGTTRSITNAYGQTVKVQIPAGTQPGERLRLRGQGVATAQRTGDLFVEVQVMVPRSLTDAQRAELEAAARRIGIL